MSSGSAQGAIHHFGYASRAWPPAVFLMRDELAEALIADGCDALAFTEDTPTVVQVGEEHTKKGQQIYTFSHYSPMQQFAPDSAVSGELVDWGGMYVKILTDIHNGTWTNEDMWWRAAEGAAILGSDYQNKVNPKFVDALKAVKHRDAELGQISVYDLVMKRLEQMSQNPPAFEPFTGPVTDNKGTVRIAAGAVGSKGELLSIDYYVDNVVGDIPK